MSVSTSPLSLTGKRWILDPSNSSDLVDRLMRERSLDVSPSKSIINPNVMPDMRKTVERIEAALKDKEKIAIFGDYDCDGITSTAQLVRFFKRNDVDPIVRLPHRVHDGYGLNDEIVNEFIKQKITLLITVDTGISSIKEIAKAQKARSGRNSYRPPQPARRITTRSGAFTPRSGARLSASASVWGRSCSSAPAGSGGLLRDTDTILAMIGTVADLVELKGDNRMIVQRGLTLLSRTTDKTLLKLIEIYRT